MTQQTGSPNIPNDELLWAALCYPIFLVMPLVALLIEEKKNKAFIKYHATQALILQVILLVVMGILSLII